MRRRKQRFVVYWGNRPIHVLKLGTTLVVLLTILIALVSVATTKKPLGPPLESRFNDTSEFITKYDYPFTSKAQRDALENDAYLISYGQEIYNISPNVTGVWPSGYGQPLTMSVYFPPQTISPEDPEAMRWTDPRTHTIYSCFRGVPVPRNNPSALRSILGIFSKTNDATGGGFAGWAQVQPIHLCFAEGTEPDVNTQFLDVLGVYRYNAGQTPVKGQPQSGFGYPMIEVGSSESVGYDQIAAAARTILRSGVTFQRGKLRISLDRVELAPNSTRVHFTVINGTDESQGWEWHGTHTFLLLDGSGGQSVFPLVANSADELPSTFGPARTEGSIFFPRIQQPSQSMVLKMTDPVNPEATIEFNFPLDQLRDVPAVKRL